jgi:transposase
MMGERRVQQEALFYEFSLERHVPETHLLRHIDRFVELDGLRRELVPFYSEMGRPSIDPELLIRMLIVGYCFGIRSERRLCEEVHLNLAYRWFCRLGLDGAVPDHSTFSKNRHGRFRESDLLRRLFETVLQRCIDEGLVGGEGFAVDASLIQADASDRTRIEGATGLPPEAAGRAVEEYLAVLDDAAFGAASEVTPKFIAPADPATRWTAAHRGPAFFAYSNNYLIDVENAIIVDVEATTAIRQAEMTAAKRMVERSITRFDLYPERLIGDSAYGSAEMLHWLVDEQGIQPHIPVFDKSQRADGTFSRDAFIYDHKRDCYICPAGKELRKRQKIYRVPPPLVDENGMMRYRASKLDCESCSLKPQCCPKAPARKIPRSIHEGARDMARDIAATDAYVTSRRERKKVEMLFAHLKRILKLDRLRLRGPNGARDEFHLAATAQNLRKLAMLIPMPAPISAI